MNPPISNKKSLEELVIHLLMKVRNTEEPQIQELAQKAVELLTQFIDRSSPNGASAGIEEVLGDQSHFVLYPQRHEFYVNNGDGLKQVHLMPKEFQIIEYLMKNFGKICSSKDIANAIWGVEYEAAAREYTKVHIKRLRKKLGVQASHIVNIYRSGYLCDVPNSYVSGKNIGKPADGKEGFLHYKDLELNLENYVLYKGDKPIHLTPMEFKVIAILMGNSGMVVTRKELSIGLYGESAKIIQDRFFKSGLNAHMSNLRRKIGDDQSNPKYIVTVKCFGYKMPEPLKAH